MQGLERKGEMAVLKRRRKKNHQMQRVGWLCIYPALNLFRIFGLLLS